MPYHRKSRVPLGPALLALLAGLVTAGCSKGKQAPPAPPPPVVAVLHPVVRKVQNYYEYNGYLEAIESVQVSARVEGVLTGILFEEGDEIEKGKPLYTIDNREYLAGVAKSEADIAKAEADAGNAATQVKLAQSEFDRLKGLGAAAVSKSELEKAEGTVAVNQAQLKLAVASKASAQATLSSSKLKLEYTDIKAEISGRISRTLVTRGNLVGQKDPTLLTTILSVDPLFINFDVPEQDFVEYQKSVSVDAFTRPAKGDLRVDIGIVNEQGYPHVGFMDFRDNRVETGTGTIRLRGRIPNPTVGAQKSRLLYPGLYSRVRIPRGEPQEMLLIPEDALMTGQEGQYVLAIGPDNTVMKRSVKVGRQIWRSPAPDEAKVPGWSLVPPKSAAPSDAAAPALRSLVAIERSRVPGKGLTEADAVIVVGLQKARPGAAVQPEVWELSGPPPAAP